MFKLKQTQQTVKDLILFDSAWRKKYKLAKKLPSKVLNKLAIYRDLVKSSFNDLIIRLYPNTYKLLKKDWKSLLSKYIELYPPHSPILNRVGEKFSLFLSKQKAIVKKYPFISELALYEWLELEIYEMENPPEMKNGKTLLQLNPINQVCNFNYNIPAIIEHIKNNLTLKNTKPAPINLLIYRDPKDFSARFIELSAGAFAYLELLRNGFSHETTEMFLANHYNINEAGYKNFNHELKNLRQALIKKRVLIQ